MPTGLVSRCCTPCRRSWSSLAVAATALLHLLAGGALAQVKPLIADASDPFFEKIEIPSLRLTVSEKQLDKLRAEPRTYVKMKLVENDATTYDDVAVKLKGAAGSFRDWDDRPALTLNMKKFNKKGEFHGLAKFHLNNSVQDETYLNEWLCSDVFRRAGIPTPRVTFARVWLNDRDVGLYVLKESFDEQFVKRYFPDASGNLYEGGFVTDLDGELEKDAGEDPEDRADLEALVAACREPHPAERVKQWKQRVDVDEFLKFMALERMTGHWDGYTVNGNNYRVYFRPGDGKAVFLPHGMDQTFASVGMGLFDPSDWMVAAPALEFNELLALYRHAARQAMPFVAPDVLIPKVDLVVQRLRPVIEQIDAERAKQHAEQIDGLKERLREEWRFLEEHIKWEPEPVQEFNSSGVAKLDDWYPETENDKIEADEKKLSGKPAFHVAVREPGAGSWRRGVLLGPGEYSLTAKVKTKSVVPLEDSDQAGAGIGLSRDDRPHRLLGTVVSKTLTYDFTVCEDRKLKTLVLELRAKSGEAWFDRGSVKLLRKPLP